MNRIFKSLIICSVLLTAAVGCSDMFREEIYDIHEELDKINARLDELSKELNTNVSSLQTIIEALQQKDYVDKITPIMEGGVEIGYEIIFTQSGSVKIYHGEKGDEGHSPVVGMKQEQDGRWYWTIDGEWMLDDNKNKVLAIAEDGKDGLTPKFEVRDGDWYISYDDGETWKYYAQATGDKGEQGDKGDSMFSSVEHNDQYITLVLADGVTTIKLPTWASHQLLVDEIARINNNIDALQKAVAALEKNDYVTKVTPIEGEDGAVLGYVLSFAFTGDVSIYHGKDGEDGHNPVVGAKQDTDGNWYWTVDDQWLLDENGAKIRTTGDDGLTPKFKIEDGQWYIRYNDEEEWKEYGQATGDKGEQGETGNAGDSIFAKDGIDVSNPNYIELTLANGTKIQIPTLASVLALENFVNQLNENIISLQTIVTGLQNNDYVTSVSDIIDPQTNEKIGYTLHFSKSGNVDIYHGEDGKDGEAGKDGVTPTVTISEDGYWVINGVKQSVKAVGVDGINGTTPKFKIENGKWMVSYDNGGSWTEAGQATGDQGPAGPQGPQGPEGVGGTAGDTLFKSITEEYATDEKGNVITDILGKPTVAYIVITLNDNDEDDTNNPVYKIPTDYVIGDLQKQIDAITNDIKTIQTVLNAVQNAEYIKECTPLYDGLVHVGYEIVFAKFTVENGEQTRKTTIYNGTDGVNGTVIGALYDETTQTWYWTIDDQPLKDANGNLVPLQGKDGVNGVAPQMNINATTNFWEVSYDGGKTWESTGVKATGPQGENGSAGSSAESYIQDVKEEGDYYVFYVKDGSTITVPTAKAFETLAKKVAALEESSASISSILGVLNGMKFVKSSERFENETGSGYKLVLVTFDPATMAQTEETCYVYDGKDGAAGAAGADGKTPVVGLRQDADGDYYWTLDGADILVDGKPVKANGADGAQGQPGAAGPVPTFRIDTDGYLWVKVGDAEEQNLGKVVGATGSAGTAGSNASIDVTEEENGKIIITFKNDGQSTGSITVPSWNAFLELQAQVNTMNDNVTALQSSVDALLGHDCVIAVVEDKKDGEVVGYTLTFAKSGDKYISLGKDGADGQPGAPGNPGTDGHTPVIGVAAEDGVLYWTVDAEWLKDEAGNKVPVTGATGAAGADGKTPKFKIVDGDWYYSYEKENTADNDIEGWTYAGRATGSTGATGGSGDSFFSGVTAVGSDQVTVVGAAEAYYIKMELVDGSSYLIPTQKTTDAINSLLTSANSNIEAIQASVAALQDNDYVTKVEEYKENGVALGYKIYFSKGTEAIIYHGAKGDQGDKGADGVTPTVSINEQGYWVINGEVTEVKAAGDKGNDGITPEFKIDSYTDSEGNIYTAYWFVKYGENAEWKPLHQALGPQGPQGDQGPVGPEGPVGPQGPAGVTGDAFIHSITPLAKDGETAAATFADAWYIRIILNDTTETLEDNPTYVIPTRKVSDELYGLVEKLNENVESLSTIVNALDARQYLISYGPYQDTETGKTGYRLTLSDGDDEGNEDDVIYIWHGTDGENGSTPSVAVKKDEDGKLYWTVNGEWLLDGENKVPATGDKGEQGEQGNSGVDAKTPEFKIGSCEFNSETYDECWLVSYDKGLTWNPVLGADGKPFGAKGDKGEHGDAFFTSVDVEKVGDNITYLILTTVDGVQHKIPTKYTFELLEARVNVLETEVNTIKQTVELHTQTLESLSALSGDVTGLLSDVATLKTLKFIGTPVQTETGWTIPVTDGTGKVLTDETITITNGKDGADGTKITVCTKEGSDKLYWVIDGVVTDYAVTGNDGTNGVDGKTPMFQINAEGVLQYRFAETEEWINLDKVVGENGTPGTPGKDGAVNVVFTNDPETYGTDTETVTAADALWVGVQYGEAADAIIWMPTYKNFQTLAARVMTVENTIKGLQPLISGQTFITGITEKTVDGKLVGIEYESVTVKEDGTFSDPVRQTISFTGLVTPGENGFKVITGYNEDGTPKYTEMSWAHTPEFKTENGKVWMTINGTDWIEVYEIPADNNTNYYGKTEENKDANGVVVGYKIYFPDGNGGFLDPIEVVSKVGYELLVARVTSLETTVDALQNLLNGKTFITSVTPVTADNGVVVGFTYGSVSIDTTTGQLTPKEDQTIYLNGLVIPNETNDGFKVITGYDQNGTPEYAEMSWAHTPQFQVDGGKIQMSIDGGKTWIDVYTIPADKDTNDYGYTKEIKNVAGVLVGYEVYFPDGNGGYMSAVQVPAYIESPIITFSAVTDSGTLTNLDNGEIEFDLGTLESGMLTCTITGSFTSAPEFYTTCEGYFTSTKKLGAGPEYTYEITVTRTTAMVNTELLGKLTVYVPYFDGQTKMKQISLKATTPLVDVKSIVVPADKKDLTFTFSNLPSSTNEIKARFDTDDPTSLNWISLRKGPNAPTNPLEKAFDLAINTTGEDRECTVNFYNASGQLVDHRIIRQEPLSAINLADPNKTGTIESANCYIISEAGRYKIPLVKGNSLADRLTYGAHESISLNGTNNKIEVVASVVENGYEYLYFDVCPVLDENNKMTFEEPEGEENHFVPKYADNFNVGNSLLAVKGSENAPIDWSWHLWFCKDNDRPDNPDNLHIYKGTEPTVMNRAIGAISNDLEIAGYSIGVWNDGFYYQWGRKDPFRLNDAGTSVYDDIENSTDGIQETGASYENSIKCPGAFYTGWTAEDAGWESGKSINDPCPPGYHIPSTEIWKTEVGTGEGLSASLLTDVYPYNVEVGVLAKQIYLPYTGGISAEGNFITGEGGGTTNKTYLGTGSAADNLIIEAYAYDIGNNKGRRYRTIVCEEVTSMITGYLWSNSDDAMSYSKKNSSFNIIQCEYDEGDKKSFLGVPYYKWKNSWQTIAVQNLTEGEIKRIQDMLATENYIQNFGSSDSLIPDIIESDNTARAYQIRCEIYNE